MHHSISQPRRRPGNFVSAQCTTGLLGLLSLLLKIYIFTQVLKLIYKNELLLTSWTVYDQEVLRNKINISLNQCIDLEILDPLNPAILGKSYSVDCGCCNM